MATPKCAFNGKEARKLMEQFVSGIASANNTRFPNSPVEAELQTMEDIYQQLPEQLTVFKKRYNIPDDATLDELMLQIIKPITKRKYHTIHPKLNLEHFLSTYKTLGTKVQNIRRSEVSTDRIKDVPQVQSILESSKAFLDESYGNASEVRDAFKRQTNQHLFDAMIINRGNNPALAEEELGAVTDNESLNHRIRLYKNYLFNLILDYLKIVADKKIDRLVNPNKAAIHEAIDDLELFYEDETGVYVSALPFADIQQWIDLYIKPKNLTSDLLSRWFKKAKDKTLADQPEALALINAYNAYTMLTHFDDYLVQLFGKAILIDDFNQFTSNDKYTLSEATANLATTWRNSDDINVEEEVDSITKLAINTTPIYQWQSDTPTEGSYLTFNDYQCLIAKIKDLSYKVGAYNIVFDENNVVFDELPEYLQNFVREQSRINPKTRVNEYGEIEPAPVSVADLINNLRENPRFYLHNIVNLLANEAFFKAYESELFGDFSQDEKTKLWTLSKAIFSEATPKTNNSLYLLSNARGTTDFYAYLTQTADSIFSIKYLQYYRDEDGKLQIRTLVDMGIDNIRRAKEEKINIQSGSELIKNYSDIINKYLITPGYSDNKLRTITFTIPNTNVKATIDLADSSVKFDGLDFRNEDNWHNSNILNFIEDYLQLGLERNPTLKEQAILAVLGENILFERSLSAASRVLANQYVNMTIIKPISDLTEINNTLASLYGQESPRYNYERNDINLVSAKDWHFIQDMATAEANMRGMTTSSIVKDSNQKSQSMQSLSRLLGSFHTQWSLVEESNLSATLGALIMRPGFVESVFTTKEFYDRIRGSKESTRISTSEMAYMGFVEDFVGGMYGAKGRVHGDGHVMFLPSVNSDKNTIGRLLVDLNLTVDVKGPDGKRVTKRMRDLTSAEIDQVIRKEMYTIYGRILNRIKEDLGHVDDLLNSQLPEGVASISLRDSYTSNFQAFNEWFDLNKAALRIKYPNVKTPAQLLKKIVLDYNKAHRRNPIELVDLMHITEDKKGYLHYNKSLLAQIYRAYPQGAARDHGINAQLFEGRTYEYFWDLKRRELVTDLLKNKFKVNVNDDAKPDLKLLRENAELKVGTQTPWILPNGNMALAYVTYNGRSAYIGSQEDILATFPEAFEGKMPTPEAIAEIVNGGEVIINPLLEKWTKFDYLVTLEWMLTTVGTFAAHPNKGSDGTEIEEEAGRFNAQHKRNVSFTAAMHAFQLNTLHGIPDTYNIATIRDIEDYKGVVGGTTHKIKPFDGATFVNPFIVLLENKSLEGAKAGVTKKQFAHFKNERIGTGGIIKTAGFGLTNDWLRNSPFLLKMMEKMTRGKYIDQNDQLTYPDITKDYMGNDIPYNDDNMYFKQGDKWYHIQEIIHNPATAVTTRVAQEVYPTTGEPVYNGEQLIDDFIIDSNYELWQFFGGENSATKSGDELTLSNSSVENVVMAMNFVGTRLNNLDPKTQRDVWQPLKHSDIHYLATEGAVKQGAANINEAAKYDDDEDYDFQRVKLLQIGIQLDKEHHADDGEISLMTQVIQACSSLGYSFDKATNIYNALRILSEHGMADHIAAMNEYMDSDKSNPQALQEQLVDSIIKNLATSNSENFAKNVAMDLIQKAREGREISFSEKMLPLSDGTVYAKMISATTVFLTNTGIKYKIPGLLAVLTPSYNIFKLWDGRKRESFENFEEEIQQIQKSTTPIFVRQETYDGGLTYKNHPVEHVAPGTLLDADGAAVPVQVNNGVILVDDTLLAAEGEDMIGKGYLSATEYANRQMLKAAIALENPDMTEGERWAEEYSTQTSNLSKMELGRHYYVSYANGQTIDMNVQTPDDYNALKDAMNFQPTVINGVEMAVNLNGVPMYVGSKATIARVLEDGTMINAKNGLRFVDAVSPDVILNDDNTLTINNEKALVRGALTRVVENKTAGRNLAAYNVRFQDPINGREYQLWDVDSIVDLFHLNEDIKNKTNHYIDQLRAKYKPEYASIESLQLAVRRLMQRDLLTLSPNKNGIKQLFTTASKQYTLVLSDPNSTEAEKERALKMYIARVNILMGRTDGLEFRLSNGSKITPNHDFLNSEEWKVALNFFENSDKVMIGGEYVSIARSTLKYQPYERIMPKTFASAFGLDEFSDLRAIEQDPDYFIKDFGAKNEITVSPANYHIALKRSNGKHTLLLERSDLHHTDLHPLPSVRADYKDGKRYRIDNNNEIMYELLDGDEVWVDENGKEVIVTDNLQHYVDNLSYDTAAYSSMVTRQQIINVLNHSSNSRARKSYESYSADGETMELILLANNAYNSMNQYNYERFPNHPAVIAGREKHSSFLKSLEIIGSRTPSQSMQSFMPEKIVAFDNPDINTSFVSTMQILLQGSDYDVDAVSTETYDIDNNGILLLWSPYANYENIHNLEASMELPMPTGIRMELPVERRNRLTTNSEVFFRNFAPLLTNRIRVDNKGNIHIEPDMSTPANILLFNTFLEKLPKLELLDESQSKLLQGLLIQQKIISGPIGSIEKLYQALYDMANRHNMYFENINNDRIQRIANNYNMYNVYQVAINPANFSQAHLSVDATTGPLKDRGNKSPQDADLKYRTPGNVVNKYAAIEENMVGKDGISIAAVGLKGFFTLTNYMNAILNGGNADALHSILLGKDGAGITIGKFTTKTLANIKALDVNTILDLDMLEALASVNLDNDAAIILSAILSLATDNAKELQLAKLNAGIKTLGMYIYGVSIGMPFNLVADILMSDVGRTLVEAARADVFNYEGGYNNFDLRFFDLFEGSGPWDALQKFKMTKDPNGEMIESPYRLLENYLKKQEEVTATYGEEYDEKETKAPALLAAYAMNPNIPLGLKIQLISNLPNYSVNLYQRAKLLELQSFCINFIKQGHILGANKGLYHQFKTLAKGAAEMKTLGLMLNLNQGIKTSETDIIKLISRFERAILNMMKSNGTKITPEDRFDVSMGGKRINLEDFAWDPAYREKAINAYKGALHTFNILAVIANSPHYLTYVKGLAMAKAELKQSIKFRTIFNEANSIAEKYRIREERVTKGLSNYLNDRLIEKWMQSRKDTVVWIPAGNKAYDQYGNLTTLNFDTPIKLGTDWGNATFRMWMELEVIPNLKAGKVAPDLEYLSTVAENPFIRDLTWTVNDRTRGHQSLVVATLPINMLPRQDSEISLFNTYKYAFKDLADTNYTYQVLRWDARGRYNFLVKDKSIIDLFTYYAMIANNWKLGEQSLVPLFADFLNNALLQDYHKFVAELDFSGDTLDLMDDEARLITYIAQNDNPYVANSEYIYGKDPITRKRILYRKKQKEDNQPAFDEDADIGYDEEMAVEYEEITGADESQQVKADLDYEEIIVPNLNFFPSRQVLGSTTEWEFDTNLYINGVLLPVNFKHNNQGRITNLKDLNLNKKQVEALQAVLIDRSPVKDLTAMMQVLIDIYSDEDNNYVKLC